MRFQKPDIVVATIIVALISCYMVPGNADILTPVVFGSVEDSPPDGSGDKISTFVPGAIDNVTAPLAEVARLTSAIVEYDVRAYTGVRLNTGTLSGTIFANNFLDTGDRMIDILIFEGDGALSVSDFQIAATTVGSVSYRPPSDRSVSFSLDVSSIVQPLLDDGNSFIGVRFAARNFQAPSQLQFFEAPTLALVPVVPEPATLALLSIGLASIGLRGKNGVRVK